jgi:hypothetical protein
VEGAELVVPKATPTSASVWLNTVTVFPEQTPPFDCEFVAEYEVTLGDPPLNVMIPAPEARARLDTKARIRRILFIELPP